MKIKLALAATTCLAVPVLAHAAPVSGPYVSLGGGTSLLMTTSSSLEFPPPASSFEAYKYKNEFSTDYAVVAGVGYGLGNGFRVELDGDFIRNTQQSDSVTASIGNPFIIHYNGKGVGAEEKYGPMLNVLYDIPVAFPITPYVGAGVGYQWVKFNRDLSQIINSAPQSLRTGGTRGSFAYDLIVGGSYPLPMMPQLSLTAEYRFMMLIGDRTYSTNFSNQGISDKFTNDVSHTFTVGLRYVLFAPPVMAPAPSPAPMASPAPAPAKTYLVFFDWNKYDLTPRATQVIADAASDSHITGVTTINVSGYTDTSGTPTYNQGLSERRAKAVADQLVVDGVPASEISIHAFGETHLLVPTGPGVREPQNRRVEIVLN